MIRQYVGNVLIFIFLFSATSDLSNAAFSISYALLFLYIINLYTMRRNTDIIWPSVQIQIPYWIFFVTIILASFIVGDKLSIQQSFRYLFYSSPFWVLYLGCRYYFPNMAIHLAVITSISIIGTALIYSFFCTTNVIPSGGFFTSHNTFSSMLILSLPFVMIPFLDFLIKGRVFVTNRYFIIVTIFAAIIGIVSLFMSKSRGGIIGFLGGAFILVILNMIFSKHHIHMLKRKVFVGSFIIICLGAWSALGGTLHRSYDFERILMWQSSYHMWQDHKIAGVGLENWGNEYRTTYILPDAREPYQNFPHNIFVYFFSMTGVIGGIGFLMLNVGIAIYLIRVLKKHPDNVYVQAMIWSYFAITIHGMVDVGITLKSAMEVFFALLGITCACVDKNDKDIMICQKKLDS